MRKWIRSRSLSIAAITLFLAAFVGQVLTGRAEYNQDQQAHGEASASLAQYLATGHFGEATLENWESEFLASFWGHAITGAVDYNEDQLAHGEVAVGTLGYLTTSRFWFESFQNWQSETGQA